MEVKIRINFDLDGTIVDLYGVEGWLPKLLAHDETPYRVATPLLKLNVFARIINRLQKQGYELGIITWLADKSTEEYNQKVIEAKMEWLQTHLPSVHWDNIVCVNYGTPKENYGTENDILFDDDANNRNNWVGVAYDEKNIVQILKNFLL